MTVVALTVMWLEMWLESGDVRLKTGKNVAGGLEIGKIVTSCGLKLVD